MNKIGTEKLFKRKMREARERITELEVENAKLKKQIKDKPKSAPNK